MLLESKHKIAFQKSLGQVVRDTFSLFYWVSHDLEACFQSSTKRERKKAKGINFPTISNKYSKL